jgi:hypothetical protein
MFRAALTTMAAMAMWCGYARATFPGVKVGLSGSVLPVTFLIRVAGEDRGPKIDEIIVSAYKRREIACHLELEAGEHPRPIPSWQYGSVPAGYRLRSCSALSPGDYSIIVNAVDARGSSHFRVDPNGAVALTD